MQGRPLETDGFEKNHCSALNIDNFYLYKMKVTIYQQN